jgi:PIN domain nuclease of toxin-antitoxin system
MNLLFDTHAVIWLLDESPRLGRRARQLIARPSTVSFLSVVSVWEMSIKAAARRYRRADLAQDVTQLVEGGFHPVTVEFDHAYAVANLPPHHSDPFDRMLVAQAQCEGMTILTADPLVEQYGIATFDATT